MQTNDCIMESLGTEHIADLLVAYFQANGASSENFIEAEREFLVAQGMTEAATIDMWYELLYGLGYSGTLSDMLNDFWCIGSGAAAELAFYALFASEPSEDRISEYELVTELETGRPLSLDDDTLVGLNEETVDVEGLLTYGAYTNLLTHSEDASEWSGEHINLATDAILGNSDEDESHYAGRANLTLSDNTLYSGSAEFKMNGVDGVRVQVRTKAGSYLSINIDLDAGVITSSSATITNKVLTALSDDWYRIDYTFDAGIGVSAPYVVFYLRDDGNHNPIPGSIEGLGVNIRKIQLTETSYRMPYVKTEGSAVSVPQNYSDADEGYKWQITPDEIGSLYTGEATGDDIKNVCTSDPANLTQLSTWVYQVDTNGTSSGNSIYPVILSTAIPVEIQITITGGSCNVQVYDYVGSAWSGVITYSIGTHLIRGARSHSSSGAVAMQLRTAGATVTIDSIKEVSRNMGLPLLLDALDGEADGTELWTDVGCTVGNNGGVTFDGDKTYSWDGTQTGDSYVLCPGILTIGSYYEVKVIASNITAGSYRVYEGSGYSDDVVGDGEFTVRGIQGVVNAYILGDIDFVGTITVTHVKEISPAQGEMVVEWTPHFDYDDIVLSNHDIITLNDSDSFIFHRGLGGHVRLADGTENALSASDINWSANTKYTINAMWGTHPVDGANKMQIIVTDGTTTWESSVVDFDGSFNPTDHFSIGFSNEFPQTIKSIKVYKEPQSW